MFAKRTLPTAIAFICGVTVVFAYFFNVPFIQDRAQDILRWQAVIAVFALGLGAVNILRVHISNFQRSKGQNFYSLALLITFVITIVVARFWVRIPPPTSSFSTTSTFHRKRHLLAACVLHRHSGLQGLPC